MSEEILVETKKRERASHREVVYQGKLYRMKLSADGSVRIWQNHHRRGVTFTPTELVGLAVRLHGGLLGL